MFVQFLKEFPYLFVALGIKVKSTSLAPTDPIAPESTEKASDAKASSKVADSKPTKSDDAKKPTKSEDAKSSVEKERSEKVTAAVAENASRSKSSISSSSNVESDEATSSSASVSASDVFATPRSHVLRTPPLSRRPESTIPPQRRRRSGVRDLDGIEDQSPLNKKCKKVDESFFEVSQIDFDRLNI